MNDLRLRWGQNVAAARLEAGYETQAALAAALGVEQQSVSRWERGAAAPTDRMKVLIADLFGVDARQLFPLTEAAS